MLLRVNYRTLFFVLFKYLFSHLLIIITIMLIHEISVGFDFLFIFFFTMERCKIIKSDYAYINHQEAAEFCHMKDMKCVDKIYPRLQMRNAKAQKKTCEI